MSGLRLVPKEDITAFELAHIVAAAGTFRDRMELKRYLNENCPGAFRHLPDFDGYRLSKANGDKDE